MHMKMLTTPNVNYTLYQDDTAVSGATLAVVTLSFPDVCVVSAAQKLLTP